jgi:hypothetical protein
VLGEEPAGAVLSVDDELPQADAPRATVTNRKVRSLRAMGTFRNSEPGNER